MKWNLSFFTQFIKGKADEDKVPSLMELLDAYAADIFPGMECLFRAIITHHVLQG